MATLALGIGGLTSLASVVRGVLQKPLPHPDSAALVQVWETRERIGRVRGHVSPADFFDWRAGCRAFDSMAAYSEKSFNVSGAGDGEPLRVEGALVSADFFAVLRATAVLGRTLDPEDDEPGAPRVAVLADFLWRRLFGGALAIGLAANGLGGVLSYGVAVRSRELALRLALGVLASLLAGRFVSHLLNGVGAADPGSFLAVVLLLTLVSLLAGYLPARRATRVDLIEALHQD